MTSLPSVKVVSVDSPSNLSQRVAAGRLLELSSTTRIPLVPSSAVVI
jgi:hypothetical protein